MGEPLRLVESKYTRYIVYFDVTRKYVRLGFGQIEPVILEGLGINDIKIVISHAFIYVCNGIHVRKKRCLLLISTSGVLPILVLFTPE